MSPEGDEPLVEIVPNFSEGRRADVVEAIVAALRVPGGVLLSWQADPDHNRLDCTVVGAPDAVRRSALAGAARAVELIDMERHRGSHPRMGAVDVVPFVPIRGISMEACVHLARETGRELAEALGLPVYLYGEAALKPERRNLADVRRGEYEGLRADVSAGRRLPDLGPPVIGRPGAVAVGARKPLIAFNVYLSGTEEGAKAVARAVREASGGLPAVRALGFEVPERGCVTVSMNLVDHEVSTPRAAFDAVRAEAERHGMHVLGSEIVGLVPEAALGDEDAVYLGLEGFDPDEQILERAVTRAMGGTGEIRASAVGDFLERVASDAPTPGGGPVAAVLGAAGAGLVAMVARLTVGKEGFEALEPRMREIVEEVDRARVTFLELADRDAAAFGGVMEAFRLPKETEEEKAERSKAVQGAFLEAAEAPLEIARLAVRLLAIAGEVTETGNPRAASDGASAAHALYGSLGSAIANVEINLPPLRDRRRAAEMGEEVEALGARGRDLLRAAEESFRGRIEG